MAFKFSLIEVLDYRKRIEEVRQGEMLEVRMRADHVEELLEQAGKKQLDYRAEASDLAMGGVDFARQQLYWNYLKGLDNLIERTKVHLKELHTELEKRRLRLADAARASQILEELEKTEKREFQMYERRAEAKEYDDIALRNYVHTKREKIARSPEGRA